MLVAAWWLFRALRPRLTNDKPSRFAFPHLADADLGTLVAHDPIAVRRKAWVQAQTLSTIVRDKCRCLVVGRYGKRTLDAEGPRRIGGASAASELCVKARIQRPEDRFCTADLSRKAGMATHVA